MAEKPDRPSLARSQRSATAGAGSTDLIAILLALVWVAAVLSYVFLAPGPDDRGLLGVVMTLLVVFLPLALIWASASTLRQVRELRAEAQTLQASVQAMRSAWLASQQASVALQPVVERKIDELTAAAARAATAGLQASGDDRARPPVASLRPAPPPDEAQPALALGTPAQDLQPPLPLADLLQALHFPDSPDDRDGFRALRLALEDRDAARLVRAAQDVLNLLAEEGIYMDDLKPDRTRADLWRRFAAGERGGQMAALGAIRDRTSLALASGRMREDAVFRDAAHHFLRHFDLMLQRIEADATEADLTRLADSRSGRAFMLLGRIAGVFG